jgi:hypothetical protein
MLMTTALSCLALVTVTPQMKLGLPLTAYGVIGNATIQGKPNLKAESNFYQQYDQAFYLIADSQLVPAQTDGTRVMPSLRLISRVKLGFDTSSAKQDITWNLPELRSPGREKLQESVTETEYDQREIPAGFREQTFAEIISTRSHEWQTIEGQRVSSLRITRHLNYIQVLIPEDTFYDPYQRREFLIVQKATPELKWPLKSTLIVEKIFSSGMTISE